MSEPAAPLTSLADEIARREKELLQLKRDYRTRQDAWSALDKQRRSFESRLQRIAAEMERLARGEPPAQKVRKPRTKKPAAPPSPPESPTPDVAPAPLPEANGVHVAERGPSLRQLILETLGRAERPLHHKELAERILAGGYKTRSKSFPKLVRILLSKIKEVKKEGEGYRIR